MEIVHLTGKGKKLDALESFHIYKETKTGNQINDKLAVRGNEIFETIVLVLRSTPSIPYLSVEVPEGSFLVTERGSFKLLLRHSHFCHANVQLSGRILVWASCGHIFVLHGFDCVGNIQTYC